MAIHFGASSSSSSTPTSQSGTYDVFLSFRGEDTRNTFVGHLYRNLIQRGIKTFRDDVELEGGDEIAAALQKAIEEAKFLIVVFSKNYATSNWCLDELAKIMECKEVNNQIVYPIFYKVDPSEVRYQNGSFGEALAKHERRSKGNTEKIIRWRKVLTQAAKLSGRHFLDGGHEADFIETIVGEISAKLLDLTHLEVAEYPVGIESRVEDMLNLLHVGENDIRMVGIWGIAGIGKTTVAKAVYNQIAHEFEGRCFLKNVKEHGHLAQLQELLLTKMLGNLTFKVSNDDEGVEIIKKKLREKKVLIVIDDVNNENQLKKLVGDSDWFGPGSRIIITTRDMGRLDAHNVKKIYEIKKLNDADALRLLRLNASEGNRSLDQDTMAIIHDVLQYSQGLPLALVVIGSLLRNRSRDKWPAALRSHRKSGKGIHELLKISYDALADDEKEVFLHIACFFKGRNKNYVINILEGCSLNPEDGIEVLRKMALISITEEEEIWVHDLLEDMGKKIVIQESPTEPGERSRLWNYEDVHHIFVENTGTHKVRGIVVNGIFQRQQIPLSSESFLKLKNLQILMISRELFNEENVCVDYLPNELRLIDWVGCPLRYFPSNFYPRNLVVLKMDFSRRLTLTQSEMVIPPILGTSPLGKGLQIMKNLKTIELVSCNGVTKISDLSRFQNLVDLKVQLCGSLKEVTVGVLKNLVNLELSSNRELSKFKIVGEMESLKRLNLQGTAIKELSLSSIGYLKNLEELNLQACKKLTHVPGTIFELQHLQHLDLSWCPLVTFSEMYSSNRRNSHVKYYGPLFVNVRRCTSVVEISEFAREIDSLNAGSCYALRRVSKLSNILEGKESNMCRRMNLFSCRILCSNLARDVSKLKENLPDSSEVTALLSLFLSCLQSGFEVTFPGNDIPEWFTCRTGFGPLPWSRDVNNRGLRVYKFRIEFPGNFKWENKGLAFCAQADEDSQYHFRHFKFHSIYINGVCIESIIWEDTWFRLVFGHVWLYYIPFHTIIRLLRESGLPPPSLCLVDFQFEYQTLQNYYWLSEKRGALMGSCGLHVVMPEDEGVFVNGLVHQREYENHQQEPTTV
ncbi:disease resistance protein Roq1-like [Rosa sericea]